MNGKTTGFRDLEPSVWAGNWYNSPKTSQGVRIRAQRRLLLQPLVERARHVPLAEGQGEMTVMTVMTVIMLATV